MTQHIGAAKHILWYFEETQDMKQSYLYKQQNVEM